MKQALYILRHPIYGAWEMKRRKTGRYRDGFILILLGAKILLEHLGFL